MRDASYRFDVSLSLIVRKAFNWWRKRYSFENVPILEPIPRTAPKVGFTDVEIPEEWEDKHAARLTGLLDAYLNEHDNGTTSPTVIAREKFGKEHQYGGE